MSDHYLEVSNLAASYDQQQVVNNISFSIGSGELACLLGPSGCGKTTILRAICGFRPIDKGNITLGGKLLSDPSTQVLPEKRNVGMVFQDHALFPHLDVEQNIAFGLNKLKSANKANIISEMLALTGLEKFRQRFPHELSGGQCQRVSLARAIAPSPDLLLLDEPFSNLDSELRESLGTEVRDLLKRKGITAMMVTHDQHDAFALGDVVGVMSEGQLIQYDSPYNLYHAPKSRFVANFIGDGVFVKGSMIEENVVITDFAEIRGQSVSQALHGSEVELLVRPDDVKLNTQSAINGKVTKKSFKGAQTMYTLELETGDTLLSLLPSHEDFEVGDTMGISIDADHLVCFDT